MKPGMRNKGSSLVSVIALMVLLAIMSLGFLYMASFQVKAAQESRDRLECIAAGKRFQRDLCVKIATGMADGEVWEGSKVIQEAAQKDYEKARRAYEESVEEWRKNGGSEEGVPLWEEYEAGLKEQVYQISGKTGKQDGRPEIETNLKVWYFRGRALAETRFFWKGEEIQLTAEIYMEESYGEKGREKAGKGSDWKVRYYEEGRE